MGWDNGPRLFIINQGDVTEGAGDTKGIWGGRREAPHAEGRTSPEVGKHFLRMRNKMGQWGWRTMTTFIIQLMN